jgi:IS1 family transposase
VHGGVACCAKRDQIFLRDVVSNVGLGKHVSTSFVERQNLSMRMSIRRFTRLTNAFSKKIENHATAVAIWFMY